MTINSYGQKKGQESNWQFNSRSLKVGNRPLPDIYRRSETMHWKALKEIYNFGSNLTPIGGWNQEIWVPKVPGVQPGTVSGLFLGSPGKKCHSDVVPTKKCREYYMGEDGGFPRVRAVVSQVSPRSPVACRNTQKGAEWVLTNLWLVLDAGPCNNIIVPLPSLIPGLLARPSYPL